MADEWEMQTCYTDQTATVQKFLRQGFEPFWGYRIILDGKPKVKMYFKKAPALVITEELTQELREPDPIKFDLTPLNEFSNQFRSILSGLLDEFTERFFRRLSDQGNREEKVFQLFKKDTEMPMRDTPIEDSTLEPTPEPIEDNPIGERQPPAGDMFRPMGEREELPKISPSARTPQQEETIEALRKQHDNISILPGNEGGSIRIVVGATMYIVGPAGNFTTEETGARTSSL